MSSDAGSETTASSADSEPLLTLQAQPAKKGGQPSMWVRALRLAAGVGRYKTRGDDASPAGVAGGRDPSAQSAALSPFGFQSLQ